MQCAYKRDPRKETTCEPKRTMSETSIYPHTVSSLNFQRVLWLIKTERMVNVDSAQPPLNALNLCDLNFAAIYGAVNDLISEPHH
jgi:hypothetical protein